ncbi:hypothetical protein CLAFUW4_03158 [Fulvia fulva]|uniref:Uncharacterized protein n=1 Tax=Passalora fulva TaxID=5499 RepID=A0A9Q8LCB0_PASFU|nr:uncharacterized protein CLAFUR5_03142 [Fulvia fulva]KAK4631620.1 hypothetical protein CLAFUR4_03147 [Fulvia fulva]UJO14589.1 hypothetical protein CLAFUR5_03142 [Fulvia fulva]WPV10649.1 hypothetical protein CLAFUW4_03158 [Fulvia fulva]WPV26479.1 hypothetical protein CLAFUW7_03151 [Fulvia fulva]
MATPEHPLDHYTDITTSADDLISQGWHELQGATLVQVSGTYTADEIVEGINALGGMIVDKKKVHSRMNRALNIVSGDNEVSRAEVQAALDRMRIETGCQERMNGIKGTSKKKPITRERSVGSAAASEAGLSSTVNEADSNGTSAVRDTATRKATAKARVDTPMLGISGGKSKRRESSDTATPRSTTTKARRGSQGERVAGASKDTAKTRVDTALQDPTAINENWQKTTDTTSRRSFPIGALLYNMGQGMAAMSNDGAKAFSDSPMLDQTVPRPRARDAVYAVSFRSTALSQTEAAADDAALRRRVGEGLGREPESIELEVGLSVEDAAKLLIRLYRDDSILRR